MKFALGKAIILGLAVATASLSACSSHERTTSSARKENTGELGVYLQIGDLTVNSVHYVITNGINTYSGDLNVADASVLSATIGGVVAGSGYNLTLTATATNGTPCSGAAGPFTVTANQTISVNVELTCIKARNKGSVVINGTTNECPDISSVVGDPGNGCSVALHVVATDADNGPQPLSYAWTGAPGLTGANPILSCTAAGPVNLNLVVSDGDPAPGCAAPFAVTVICPCSGLPTCTDGVQNQGETGVDCGGPCPACPVATCSDGIQNQGETGIDCGGPCPACATCSDGVQNQGETGVDCGGPCPACVVSTASLLATKGAACVACANTNCPDNVGAALNCETVVGSSGAGAPLPNTARSLLCTNLLSCQLTSNCGSAVSGASNCYCGGAGATCFTLGGTGACKTTEEQGLESTVPGTIQGAFGSTVLGGGRANLLVQCLNDNGCSSCF